MTGAPSSGEGSSVRYAEYNFIAFALVCAAFGPAYHYAVLGRRRAPPARAMRIAAVLATSAVLAVTTLRGTGGDLKLVAQRLGRVPASLLPLILTLTLRPSPLPYTLYLSLLPLHKWLARAVVVQGLVHTGLYMWYWQVTGKWTKIRKFANLCGVVAMVAFIAIALSSYRLARRSNYKLFYNLHIIMTWAVVVSLYFHARPGIPYFTAMNIAVITTQMLYRIRHTSVSRSRMTPISPSLTLLEFPLADVVKKPILPSGHVRVNLYKPNSIWSRFKQFMIPLQHPYTIANLPHEDTLKLIIRNGESFPLHNNELYQLTGVFEPKLNFITKGIRIIDSVGHNSWNPFHYSKRLMQSPLHYTIESERVLICVGGSGISFGLPLLRILNFNGVNARLIWVSKDFRDLNLLNHFKNNFEGLEIYITGCGTDSDGESEVVINYDNVHDHVGLLSQFNWNMKRSAAKHEHLEEGLDLCCRVTGDQCQKNCVLNMDFEGASLLCSDGSRPSDKYGTSTKLLRKCTRKQKLVNISQEDKDNEVDFTESFIKGRNGSSKKFDKPRGSKDIFRKPSVIEPPFGYDNDSTLTTTAQIRDSVRSVAQPSDSSGIAEGSTVKEDSGAIGSSGPFIVDKPKRWSSTMITDRAGTKLTIPSGIKIFFGRPTLSDVEYDWCVAQECGPGDEETATRLNTANRSSDDGITDIDSQKPSKVWVIAAGPDGLVEATRRWAEDHNLHFHGENFAV